MSAPSDWYRTFFHGVAVEMWRQCMPPEYTKLECDFIEGVLVLPKGGRLLDVPCGHGRHAVELASRGYAVTGVDLSTEEIAAARAAASARNVELELVESDMRELPWTNRFDGGYCWGNSFGYIEEGGDAAFVQTVAKCLKPGARFALQVGVAAETVLPNLMERTWYSFGDFLFLIANRYDATAGRLETEYIFIRDGKVERRRGSQRVYALSEIVRLFADAGLRVEATYGSLTKEPFRIGSQALLLVAVKS